MSDVLGYKRPQEGVISMRDTVACTRLLHGVLNEVLVCVNARFCATELDHFGNSSLNFQSEQRWTTGIEQKEDRLER